MCKKWRGWQFFLRVNTSSPYFDIRDSSFVRGESRGGRLVQSRGVNWFGKSCPRAPNIKSRRRVVITRRRLRADRAAPPGGFCVQRAARGWNRHPRITTFPGRDFTSPPRPPSPPTPANPRDDAASREINVTRDRRSNAAGGPSSRSTTVYFSNRHSTGAVCWSPHVFRPLWRAFRAATRTDCFFVRAITIRNRRCLVDRPFSKRVTPTVIKS